MPGVTLLLPVLMTPLKLNIIFVFKNKETDSQVIKQSVKRQKLVANLGFEPRSVLLYQNTLPKVRLILLYGSLISKAI